MSQGIAPTLIAAKISVTNIISTHKELINEVFAPWRSTDSNHRDATALNSQNKTLSNFRAAVRLPSSEPTTQHSEEISMSESKGRDIIDVGMAEAINRKGSPC